MIKRLFAAVAAAALVSLGAAGTAFAAEEPDRTVLPHTGQGVNDDGTCETVEADEDVAEGRQIWHFVLTGQSQQTDPVMSAAFDDGTSVTDLEPERITGGAAHFFVETAEGASLTSASASFDTDEAGANPQFVVSNCFAREGEENGEDEDGNGEEENGNGEEENGEDVPENGERPTPAPVPTEIPAGINNSGIGVGGALGLLAGVSTLAMVTWVLRRRFVHGA